MCAKKVIQGQSENFRIFWIFLENGKFYQKCSQTKIVDRKIIYKNVPHTFFPKNHHS